MTARYSRRRGREIRSAFVSINCTPINKGSLDRSRSTDRDCCTDDAHHTGPRDLSMHLAASATFSLTPASVRRCLLVSVPREGVWKHLHARLLLSVLNLDFALQELARVACALKTTFNAFLAESSIDRFKWTVVRLAHSWALRSGEHDDIVPLERHLKRVTSRLAFTFVRQWRGVRT